MRVLVADDHSLFREGITSLLEAAQFEVVGQVGDGQAAVEAVVRLNPDLVLLDIMMPRVSGLEALRMIQQLKPTTPVVMLTMSDDNNDLLEAIQSGARGFLSKNLNGEEFLALLVGLQRGEAVMTKQTTASLLRGLAEAAARQVAPDASLTTRESELLRLVAEGMPNKAIAQELMISENTVKYHLKSILQKLAAENRTEAVTEAIRRGLLNPSLVH